MNFSKKQKTALCLAIVFLGSFFIVFLTILLTQSAYSIPNQYVLEINGMQITVGPPPNATNVPLDTTITIDALASATINNLQLTPTVDFSGSASETSGPLTYKTTFYPDRPLKPATTYEVSVTIINTPVSWTFTTKSEPFNPTLSYFLATNTQWIALLIATCTTAVFGFIFQLKRKRK